MTGQGRALMGRPYGELKGRPDRGRMTTGRVMYVGIMDRWIILLGHPNGNGRRRVYHSAMVSGGF